MSSLKLIAIEGAITNATTDINFNKIFSEGIWHNVGLSIKVARDLNISRNNILKAIPKMSFEGRIQYLKKGKIKNLFNKKEKVIVDGCSSQISAKNLADHLKTIKGPKFGIWGMIKNKNPDLFIQQFKNVFEVNNFINTFTFYEENNLVSYSLFSFFNFKFSTALLIKFKSLV